MLWPLPPLTPCPLTGGIHRPPEDPRCWKSSGRKILCEEWHHMLSSKKEHLWCITNTTTVLQNKFLQKVWQLVYQAHTKSRIINFKILTMSLYGSLNFRNLLARMLLYSSILFPVVRKGRANPLSNIFALVTGINSILSSFTSFFGEKKKLVHVLLEDTFAFLIFLTLA